MSIESMLGPVGGTAGLVAFFLWLLKSGFEHGLKKDLQQAKSQSEIQLEKLKKALEQVVRLEEELSKSRAISYSECKRSTNHRLLI